MFLSIKLQVSLHSDAGTRITVRFSNLHAEEPLTLLKWGTPLEGLGMMGSAFDVYDVVSGQAIPYLGILAKRGNPAPESFLEIAPGESISAQVDLAESYALQPEHSHTVYFNAHVTMIGHSLLMRKLPALADLLENWQLLRSSPIVVKV